VVSLRGVVASGLGQGAQFMAMPWVRDGIRRLIGFDAYPARSTSASWTRTRSSCGAGSGRARRLVPPQPETCGARLFRAVVAPDVSAAIVVPDVTRYGDDTLELVAAVHARNYFGLHDRDLVTLRVPAALAPGSS
jgi:CTP-dependent riboflavin kinase